MKKAGIIIGIIAVIALVICLVPLKGVVYAVNEPCPRAVPLEFETNSYVKTGIVKVYRQTGSCGCSRILVEVEAQIACVNVINIDIVAGNFTVSFFGIEPISKEYPLTINLSLNVSEQKIVECPTELIDDWDYEVASITIVTHRKVSLLDYLLHY